MQRIKSVSQLSLIVFLLLSTTKLLIAQEFSYPPIERGGNQWKALTPVQKHEICQIPDDILGQISTQKLIQAYLDYPFIGVMAVYNNWSKGFIRVSNDFNGIPELLKRPDSGKELFNVYLKINPANYDKNWTLVRKGKYSANLIYLETLISQERILSQFSEVELRALLEEALKKYEIKQSHPQVYGIFGQKFSLFLLGRVLLQLSPDVSNVFNSSDGVMQFLETSQISNEKILPSIIEIANRY